MTGNLTLNTGIFTSINTTPQINLKNNTYVSGQAPSSNLWNVAASNYDKNNLRVGVIHQAFRTDGKSTFEIQLQKRVNNTDYYGGFKIIGFMTSTNENQLMYNIDDKALTGGIWQGNTIGVPYGGTGATDADGARTNLYAAKAANWSGTNLDNIKSSGLFTVWNLTGTGTNSFSTPFGYILNMTNAPYEDNTGSRGRQLFMGHFSNEIWIRKFEDSWGNWRQLMNSDGAVPVSAGGTGVTTAGWDGFHNMGLNRTQVELDFIDGKATYTFKDSNNQPQNVMVLGVNVIANTRLMSCNQTNGHYTYVLVDAQPDLNATLTVEFFWIKE